MELPSMFYVPPDMRVDSASGLPTEIVRKQDGAKMVLIPAGSFLMGVLEQEIPKLAAMFGRVSEWYECEAPQRTITLSSFYIDKYEVTNKMYQQFCRSTDNRLPWYWKNGNYPDNQGCHPVHNVNWYDANKYASWADVCLPTEAQWEKAARGTDSRLFPWGNVLDFRRVHYLRLEYYWRREELDLPIVDGLPVGNRDVTAAVGSYPLGASPYGVMDMLGNVWEWCLDWADWTYYTWGPSEDPKGPQSGDERILRGCSGDYDLHKLRCSYRHAYKPELPFSSLIGFRCCYNLSQLPM